MPVPTWLEFDVVEHGEVVEGNTALDLSRLRVLYDNCANIAGDAGAGWGDGISAATGLPTGSAVAVVSSPVMWEFSSDRLPMGDKDYHVSCIMRTYDYLYYRGIAAELSWATPDEQENTSSLDDTVTAYGWPFRVVDLTQLDGLAYGRLYFARADIAATEQSNVWIFEELRS